MSETRVHVASPAPLINALLSVLLLQWPFAVLVHVAALVCGHAVCPRPYLVYLVRHRGENQ